MKRRYFIGIGFGVLVAEVIGGVVALNSQGGLAGCYRRFTAPSVDRKARVLAACFPHLHFEKGVTQRFVLEYMENTGEDANFALKGETLKRFLLSTDFVQKQGEGSFRYVSFYSPWRSVCYNPFMLPRQAV